MKLDIDLGGLSVVAIRAAFSSIEEHCLAEAEYQETIAYRDRDEHTEDTQMAFEAIAKALDSALKARRAG